MGRSCVAVLILGFAACTAIVATDFYLAQTNGHNASGTAGCPSNSTTYTMAAMNARGW